MQNQIILYNNQTVDCLIYSSKSLKEEEKISFNNDQALEWDNFSNAEIICNFDNNLSSSYINDIEDKITGYQIFKKRPEESFAKNLGIFSSMDLEKNKFSNDRFYSLIDYNVKNNVEYIYFITPLTNEYAQTTLENRVLTNWDIFSLTPIYQIEENKYEVIKDEFGETINWIFQLNCSEGDIKLNQDKTSFTTFSSKPKISIGDLNYYSGDFSCLLGNTLYNDQYYEPNILLEKWNKMIKENYIYLFKNAKGDSMIVSLEDGTKKKYSNEIANYYKGTYNAEIAITNRPTEISFSYIEITDSEDIRVCGD